MFMFTWVNVAQPYFSFANSSINCHEVFKTAFMSLLASLLKISKKSLKSLNYISALRDNIIGAQNTLSCMTTFKTNSS